MNKSQMIKLIKIEYTYDEIMQRVETRTERQVFAEVKSINANEFFSANTNGLQAQYCFKVFVYDYQNEKEIEFNNEVYSVYRTYEKGDYIDLYVESRVANENNS